MERPNYWQATGSDWQPAGRGWQHARTATQSPRPRRRGDQNGRGQGPKGGKGAKAGGKEQQGKAQVGKGEAPAAPGTDQLPKPPTVAVPQPVKVQATPSAGPTPERVQLDAILQSLMAAKLPIPPETQALVDQMRRDDIHLNSRSIHRAVSAQTTARKELGNIRTLRANYLQEWAGYITSVTELLDRQIAEQQQLVSDLDDREQTAHDAWLKARADLNRLTKNGPQCIEDDDPDEAEAMVEDLIEVESLRREARAEEKAKTEELRQALSGLRQQAAEQAASAKRDGSRTPRRHQKPSSDVMDLTKETEQGTGETKQAAASGEAEKPKPGVTTQPPGRAQG